MWEHLLPERPVVLFPTSYIQPVVDAFLVEKVGQVLVGVQADIPFRGAQDDIHLPERRMVIARQIVYRVVKIDIIVVITIHKHLNIECAAHGKQMADQFGVLKGKIGSVIATEAGTGHCYLAPTGIPADAWHQLMEEHLIVPNVVFNPVGRVNAFVVPAQRIYTVGAENLEETPFHIPMRRLYQPEVLAFVVPPLTGREQNDRIALMPENQHFDIPAEALGVPFVISLFHVFRLEAAPEGGVIVLLTISGAKIRAFLGFQRIKLLVFKCLSDCSAIV